MIFALNRLLTHVFADYLRANTVFIRDITQKGTRKREKFPRNDDSKLNVGELLL